MADLQPTAICASFIAKLLRLGMLCALIAGVFLPSAAHGQDGSRIRGFVRSLLPSQQPPDPGPSWSGRRILPAAPGIRIGHTDEMGQQVFVAELTDLVYTVEKDQDGWLMVRQRGVEGWLPKGQAVLLQDAVAFFTDRIRANDRDAFALARRGRAWREQDELEKALADLTEAIRLEPNHSTWFANRGMVHDELRAYDRALRDFDEAIRLDPKDALAYNSRGVAYKASKEYDRAIADYGRAIELNPGWSDAYFNRGNAYKARGDYERAIRDYSDAIRLDRNWPDPYFNRANAQKARKAYEQAANDYAEVIRLDPKDADAHSSLAWLLATCPAGKVRDGKRAVEHATRACELTSWDSPYFLAVLAATYAEAGDFDQAVKWQRKALESPQYERADGDQGREQLELFLKRLPFRES